MPSVEWTKDGNILSSSGRTFIYTSEEGVATVRLEPAAISDNGEYRCTARNIAGIVSETIQVSNVEGECFLSFPACRLGIKVDTISEGIWAHSYQ